MTIKNIGNSIGPGRPTPIGPAKGVQGPAGDSAPAGGAATPSAPARARTDSVQISDAARALAGGTAEAGAAREASGTLGSERIAELRQKVLEGAYNSVQVVDQVAKRILGSGDL